MRDDIIRMAKEVWETDRWTDVQLDRLERFYNLAVQHERNRTWTQQHWTDYEKAIVAKEREECAKVCDALHYEVDAYGAQCAAAIRARKD